MCLLKFLKQTRKLLTLDKSIYIIIGNESCDLDSAVCAISLAFFYHRKHKQCKDFLPVLNIPRCDYPLKTEVHYLFEKHGITEDSLTFRDELTTPMIANSYFILVDHHVSPYAERCKEIYDHRPLDALSSNLPNDCVTVIERVGSCATLIAEKYLKSDCDDTDVAAPISCLAHTLLHSTMVLDTVNFSEEAKRATAKDWQYLLLLEKILNIGEDQRAQIFKDLVAARGNISQLTTHQLLRKDLKVLSVPDCNVKIALPGFPFLVQHFITKPDAAIAIQQFAKDHNSDIVLLLGMYVFPKDNGNGVHRDIGLIDVNSQSSQLYERLKTALLTANEPNFNLTLHADCHFMEGAFFNQENITATRKDILPIVKNVLNEYNIR